MKVYISVDMEGISGVHNGQFLTDNASEYERGRRFLMGDLNTAIEASKEAGATEILVNDAHGRMSNIILEDLAEPADLIAGTNKHNLMMAGLDETFDAAILLGYHAKSGNEGILAHTISGKCVRALKINGEEYGESGLSAAIAGQYSVPIAAVSGDDKLKDEIRTFLPDTRFAQTKESLCNTTGKMYNLAKSRANIKKKIADGFRNIKNVNPFDLGDNLNVEVTLKKVSQVDLIKYIPGVNRISPLKVKFIAKNISEVNDILFVMINLV